MKRKNFIKSLLAGAIVSALLFFGCSQTTSSNEDLEFPEEDLPQQSINIYQQEFLYNYFLLSLDYLYAHTRGELSENPEDYYGIGISPSPKMDFCTKEFLDVCYLYSQMADPYTRYFDPAIANELMSQLQESEEVIGIGAEVEEVTDENSRYLKTTQVYVGSPSEKAGLQPGDILYTIDGLQAKTISNFEKLTQGSKGDTVALEVIRDGDTLSLSIIIDEFKTPSVFVYTKDSIPVIRISQFLSLTTSAKGTYGEFLEALEKTKAAKSTVIDLRDNPGGVTEQCSAIAAELLSQGDTILTEIETTVNVVVVGKDTSYVQAFDTTTTIVTKDGLGKDRYYVLLADTASASCAEVVLSALGVNKKTPIVGQTSYGKGIGQIVVITNPAQGLALITDAISVDKNSESYHDLGIVPDYEINDPQKALEKAIEVAKEAKEKRRAGYGTQKQGHFSKVKVQEKSNEKPTLKNLKVRYKFEQVPFVIP